MADRPTLPIWFDRLLYNVSLREFSFTSEVGPHAVTTRWSYTVPSGARALSESLSVYTNRTFAATSGQNYAANIRIRNTNYIDVFTRSNNIDVIYQVVHPVPVLMLAGDTASAATADSSSGGAVRYNLVGTFWELQVA